MNDVPGAEEAILSLKSMEKTGLEMVLDSIHSADNDDEALRLLNHGYCAFAFFFAELYLFSI